MNTETEERPSIADEVVDQPANANLAPYSETEAALAELELRLSGKTYDLKTTAGDKEARADRLELTRLISALEARRQLLKAPILARGRMLDDEAKRITEALEALRRPIDAQIKADEVRREAERKAKEERRAQLRRRIDEIRAAATGHARSDAKTLAEAITAVKALDVSREQYDELADEAAGAKTSTLETLRQLHAGATEREAEAARLAAERAKLARDTEFNARLQRIRALPLTIKGRTAAAIEAAMAPVKALQFDTWGEWQEQAEQARAEAVETMEAMHAEAFARETEAADLARQREEQAAQQRRLDEERAALAAQQAAAAQSAAQDSRRQESEGASTLASDNPVAPSGEAKAEGEAVADAAASPGSSNTITANTEESGLTPGTPGAPCAPGAADTATAAPSVGEDGQAARAVSGAASPVPVRGPNWPFPLADQAAAEELGMHAAPAPDEKPTLKLGEICKRLGFTVTADFLEARGYPAHEGKGPAKLYRESDFRPICAAIALHCTTVAMKVPA